jgi:deoxyribose-phosphate aldolase
MLQLSHEQIPPLIDVSCVRTDVKYEELDRMAAMAKKYGFIAAFPMPCHTERLRDLLRGSPVRLGGVAGFPSGADTVRQKVDCAKYMKAAGCDEIDMVINVGALRSGDDAYVLNELKEVIAAAAPLPVKTILECAYLEDAEIVRGCALAVEAGAAFVKSGTGWAAKPTTVDHIRLMKTAVDGRAQIKAAGGVRSLRILEEMYDAGCRRFGVSLLSALRIVKEACERDRVIFEDGEILSQN